MARILADRVLESTTSTGVGPIALSAAITGFRRFSAVCSIGDTVPYFIEALDSLGQPTGDYEYGLGTYSAANTLTRTTVQGSSNGGAPVNFAAGSKNVGLTLQADGFQYGSNANGYWMKFPNGVIEQWGTVATSGAGSGAVTFPIPFPTGPTHTQADLRVAGVNNPFFTHADDGTSVGLTVYACNGAGVGAAVTAKWRARGT